MTATARFKYSVNRQNQLMVRLWDSAQRPVEIPGSFELTENHSLRYRFNPLPKNLIDLGFGPDLEEIVFTGKWYLGSDHTLRFRIQDSAEELVFRSSFVSANADRLVFSITTLNPSGAQSTRLFKFEGNWQADEKNRLTFILSYRESDRDRFVFEGRWRIGRKYEIIYRYVAEEIKTGRKRIESIILKGFWNLDQRGYLDFLVEGSSNSQFRFKAEYLGYRSLRRRFSELKFRVGIEIRGSAKEIYETIKIFGRWKVRAPLELGFEVTYENERVEEIKFLASYEFVGKDMIDLELFNSNREGLGIQATVLTKVFGDRANLFLKVKATEKEKMIEGGVNIKW